MEIFSSPPINNLNPNPNPPTRKKRNLPGTPDPDAEVMALSPKTLMATNRFLCEICNKGFQRDQNLQLHRRGHNLPWKLKQRANKDQIKKKVYICPEKTCVHHDPARALGDLTGIKKHFSRKHGEKKWKCDKCSKKYAVQSDWKAHSKTCGTREYKCDCGTLFSRKDSFITHRAFCDALAEESVKVTTVVGASNFNLDGNLMSNLTAGIPHLRPEFTGNPPRLALWMDHQANSNHNDHQNNSNLYIPEMIPMPSNNNFFPQTSSSMGSYANLTLSPLQAKTDKVTNSMAGGDSLASLYSTTKIPILHHLSKSSSPPGAMSATALLQKASQMGSTRSGQSFFGNTTGVMMTSSSSASTNNHLSFVPGRTELHQVFGQDHHHHQPPMSSHTSGGNGFKLQHGLGVEDSLTRDFLGVAGDGGGDGPFLPQELASFDSMPSAAIGMRHYSTDY